VVFGKVGRVVLVLWRARFFFFFGFPAKGLSLRLSGHVGNLGEGTKQTT